LGADEGREGADLDGLEEGRYLIGTSGGEQFHTAIGEVANRAGNVVPGGDLANAVPETDPLDSAFVEYLAGDHKRVSRKIGRMENVTKVFVRSWI
jgi:hypothetical protein